MPVMTCSLGCLPMAKLTISDAAATREQDVRANAQTAREEPAPLLQMLQDMLPRYDRLLDMPRTASLPRPASGPRPEPRPTGPLEEPRGAMCRRIVALLREHPEGLTPVEIRARLGADRSLADTCLGRLRYGLGQRVGRGRYVATEPSRTD